MGLIKLFALSLILVSGFAFADKLIVETTKEYPSEEFPANKYEIKKNKKSEVLPPNERDALFSQAGLTEHTANMDHLDKDVLLLRARTMDIKQFEKQYPNIPSSKLILLKKTVPKK